MIHAMVDIEALGKGDNALVVSAALVAFSPDNAAAVAPFVAVFDPLVVNVRLQSALDHGAQVDGSTLRFWMEQDDAARKALFVDALDESTALARIREWWQASFAEAIWGHGVNFDLRLLGAAFRRHGQRAPWHYRQERDTRTLFDLVNFCCGAEVEKACWAKGTKADATKHIALNDAQRQAVAVQAAYTALIEGDLGQP